MILIVALFIVSTLAYFLCNLKHFERMLQLLAVYK